MTKFDIEIVSDVICPWVSVTLSPLVSEERKVEAKSL